MDVNGGERGLNDPAGGTATRLRRRSWFGILLLTAVGLLLGGVCYDAFNCVGKEQVVFAEFPHYSGKRVAWTSNLDGRCYGSYTAPVTQEEALKYYQTQLKEHGWFVVPVERRSFPLHLRAYRDGFEYSVFFLDAAEEGYDEVGTRVHIQGGPGR